MQNSNFNNPFDEENFANINPNASAPNQYFPQPGTPPGELTKPWPPQFAYSPNPPVIDPPATDVPQPPQGNDLSQENIAQMVNCMKNTINTIKNATPVVDRKKYRSYINESNIYIIEEVAEYAAEHPQTVNALIDVPEWMQTLNQLHTVYAIQDLAKQLQTVLLDFVNSEEIVAYQDFQKYYKCIKLLAAENLPDAVAIYPTMKQIFANRFGKTGPHPCPLAEIKNAMNLANNVITKHKSLLSGIINDETKLKNNLQNEIHADDNVLNEK